LRPERRSGIQKGNGNEGDEGNQGDKGDRGIRAGDYLFLAACRRETEKPLFSSISQIGHMGFSAEKLFSPTNC
jgi:hypothetical protein